MLVLLHGLGATGEVWRDVVPHWEGSWLVPDLPGHGRSDPIERYSFGTFAGALAPVIPAGEPVAILGHSLGGVVGLALASGWFGVTVSSVVGLGIKVQWSDEDLARAASFAERPAKTYDNRDDAVERASKVAGVPIEHGVTEVDEGWQISLDAKAFAVGAPDMRGLLQACRARVTLAAGEHDHMGPPAHLTSFVPSPVVLDGQGHNVHVEAPAALAPLLEKLH
ncbi:alpha/beta hydrolase [Lentzea sp. NBRC 105346]|nr:alpha/beta hydrolase [Lentzea sp. NBRC 105346]